MQFKASEPRAVDQAFLDAVLVELKQIETRAGWARVLGVGQLILERFFHGDVRVWRERRRNKNKSIRELAARRDCPLRKSALTEAVAVYAFVRERPHIPSTLAHLGPSHVAAVLPLAPERSEELLRLADVERLSVRDLKQRAAWHKRQGGERRGRPPSSPAVKALTKVRSGTAALRAGSSLLEGAAGVSSRQAEALDAALRETLEAVEQGRAAVSRFLARSSVVRVHEERPRDSGEGSPAPRRLVAG